MAEESVDTTGACSKEGKLVVIAFDGSDYTKNAMKCELFFIVFNRENGSSFNIFVYLQRKTLLLDLRENYVVVL